MKKKLCYLLSFFVPLLMQAQGNPLTVGDTVPDIRLSGTINYGNGELRLKDLQGKAVLLDFWAPTCISCLEKFPEMDALQKRFKDSLVIVLVNAQDHDSTLRFFAARKKIRMPDVILAPGDTLLSRLFPHDGVPFHVWIDRNGIVRHLANAYSATPENISDFLVNKQQQFFAYQPRQHYIKSLFDPQWQEKLKYYSYISNGIWGTQPGSDLGEDYAHMTFNNASVVELYRLAYSEITRYDFTRPGSLILHVSDTFAYVRPQDNNRFQQWFESFSYNYDLQVPKEREKEMHRIMQEDLRRYFGLKVWVHKKEMLCWVLVRTSAKDKLASKSKISKNTLIKDDVRVPMRDSIRYLLRQPYKTFSVRLGGWIEQGLQLPFIDATGFDEMIDIRLPGDLVDNIDPAHLVQLRKELQRYGLGLLKKTKSIDVLEIRDSDSSAANCSFKQEAGIER